MKKFVVILGIFMGVGFAHSAFAQMAGSDLFTDHHQEKPVSSYKKGCFGLDLGVGTIKDVEGTGIDLGFRWLYNFSPYIGWDIIGVKGLASTDDIGYSVVVQGMTGIRGNSPCFVSNMSVFANFRMGYGYMIDMEEGGMCYELGLGVNLTRTVYIGFVYSFQGGETEISVGRKTQQVDIKMKYSAFRLGFNF